MNTIPEIKTIRAVGIVLHNDQLLVMHRIKNGLEYYTFPGGSVELGERIEDAVLRELLEETSIKVKIIRLLYKHIYETSEQYYYLCEYIKGEVALGDSIEKERMAQGHPDIYNPMWIPVSKLSSMLLYPLEIRDWLLKDLADGFSPNSRGANLKISELRQSL